YFATGDSYSTIGHSFRVGFSTVSKIVVEVSEAIIKILGPMFLPEPTTAVWKESAKGFYEKWQFSNCIGSVDGKHVTIKCPNNSGTRNYCYLKKFSLVLMAVVDPDYKFICIDVGRYGRNSDGGILEESVMGKRLEAGTLNVPKPVPLPGQIEDTPMVLIGDEAFALKTYLMKPFPRRQSRSNTRLDTYKYRLCRARRVVENAFGILSKKCRVYKGPIELKEETTIKLDEDQSVIGALEEVDVNNRRGTNEAL
ncbi:DDE Tnp4 domain-containing protein, partial [Aphis craccivora]